MNDEDADQIIEYPKEGTKYAYVYPNNEYFEALKSAYPDYYEEGCGCMIFPYEVWKTIQV